MVDVRGEILINFLLLLYIRLRGQVLSSLIEKSLGSSRVGTKQKAIEAILYFIELDTPDPTLEELIPFTSHRIPKLVAGTTLALTEVYKAFGAKVVSPKPVVKVLPKLFAHADKNVRKEATDLSVVLYSWLGDGFKDAIFPDLKPVQQKELEPLFQEASGETPQQTRLLRSQKLAIESENAEDADEDEEENAEMDFAEEVEIKSKMPSQFTSRITSTKWKDRKEVLEEFFPIVNVPKLKPDDYSEILRILAKCVAKDANVQVVVLAANCIESFAKGLRTEFARYVNTVLSSLLERLKEKKASVSDALKNALEAVYGKSGSGLGDILEDVLEYLKHKTPQIKIETAKFLAHCLKTTKVMPSQAEFKAIMDSSLKLLADTQEPVRNGGMEILGIVMKLVGERAMNPVLENVDDIKKGKIQEFYKNAEVKAKAPKAASATAATNASVPSPQPKPGLVKKKPLNASASQSQPDPAAVKRKLGSTPSTRISIFDRLKKSSSSKSTETSPSPSPSKTAATPIKSLTSRAPVENQSTPSETIPAPVKVVAEPDPKLLAQIEQLQLENQKLIRDSEEHVNTASKIEKLQLENRHLSQEITDIRNELVEERSERERLLQEIEHLRTKNTQLQDAHTRDTMTIKSKETQLVRAMSDLENLRSQVAEQHHSSTSAYQSPILSSISTSSARLQDDPMEIESPSHSRSGRSGRYLESSRYARASMLSSEGLSRTSFLQEPTHSSELSSHAGTAGSNWKRAAEVTEQLRQRIEKMKAKNEFRQLQQNHQS